MVRVARDQAFELGHQLRVPAEGEVRVDPPFDGADAFLVEACRLRPCELARGRVREALTSPELEGVAERLTGGRAVARRHRIAPAAYQRLETQCVDGCPVDVQDVAGPA